MTMIGEQLTSISGLVVQFQQSAPALLRIVESCGIKPAIWLDATPFFDAEAVEQIRKTLNETPANKPTRKAS